MKLIHCSDIHLDSKLETNLTAEQAQLRNHEICHSFERMAEYAQANQVQAILICGDLFDTKRVTATTVQFILDVITRFHTINFFYLRGNHDEQIFQNRTTLPRNLNLFSDTWRYYRSGNIVIAGIELTEKNSDTLYSSLDLKHDDKNIVILHGQISGGNAPESICLPKLRNKHIDYIALGHIHAYQSGQIDHRGTYAYSGCLEGRGYDEAGEKGFVLLEISDSRVRHSFVPFAARTIHKINADVSGISKITNLLQLLRELSQNIPERDMVEFVLTGQHLFVEGIDVEFLENMLSPKFFSCKITNRARLKIESEGVLNPSSLKSAFIRSVQSDPSLTEDEINEVLELGIAALYGKEGYPCN